MGLGAGNLVLILTGDHTPHSCTACRNTDSFAATTGHTAFGRTAHRHKHHYKVPPPHLARLQLTHAPHIAHRPGTLLSHIVAPAQRDLYFLTYIQTYIQTYKTCFHAHP